MMMVALLELRIYMMTSQKVRATDYLGEPVDWGNRTTELKANREVIVDGMTRLRIKVEQILSTLEE